MYYRCNYDWFPKYLSSENAVELGRPPGLSGQRPRTLEELFCRVASSSSATALLESR